MLDVIGFTEASLADWIEGGYRAASARLDEVLAALEERRAARAARSVLAQTIRQMESRAPLTERVNRAVATALDHTPTDGDEAA